MTILSELQALAEKWHQTSNGDGDEFAMGYGNARDDCANELTELLGKVVVTDEIKKMIEVAYREGYEDGGEDAMADERGLGGIGVDQCWKHYVSRNPIILNDSSASKFIDIARSAVESEPELPGEMPDDMWMAVKNDRDAITEAMRIAVRQTKRAILARLESALGVTK